jgi:predicted anti-sigma-YlaC factor YlaD
MNCNHAETVLDDYLDDILAPEARGEVDRHLVGCPACRNSVEELLRLQQATRELPRGIAPERDLLPGIRDRIGREARGAAGPRWLRWVAVAASLIVLTGAVWVGLRSLDPDPPTNRASTGPSTALLAAEINLAEFEAAETQYEEATARLLGIVEARSDELSPETRAVIEQNLQIIDQAIDQVREALDAEPGDTRTGHILNTLYRQKVEFLWRVSRLSS